MTDKSNTENSQEQVLDQLIEKLAVGWALPTT